MKNSKPVFYVFKEYTKAYFAIFLVLFLIVFCWNLAIFSSKLSAIPNFFILFYGVFLKSLVRVHQIIPLVFLVSIIHVIYDFKKSNQILAMKVLGYRYYNTLLPGLLIALLFSYGVLFLENYVRPDFMLNAYASFCKLGQERYCQKSVNIWQVNGANILHLKSDKSNNYISRIKIINLDNKYVKWINSPKYLHGFWFDKETKLIYLPKSQIKYFNLLEKDQNKSFEFDLMEFFIFLFLVLYSFSVWHGLAERYKLSSITN